MVNCYIKLKPKKQRSQMFKLSGNQISKTTLQLKYMNHSTIQLKMSELFRMWQR